MEEGASMFADTKKVVMYAYLEHEPPSKTHAADFLRPIEEAWVERRKSGAEETGEEDIGKRRQEHCLEYERRSRRAKHGCG